MELDWLEKLKDCSRKLEEAFDKKEREFIRNYPGVDPWDVTDTVGRPILLDALTTMVNVQATLALISELPPPGRYSARRGAPIPGGVEREKGRVSTDD